MFHTACTWCHTARTWCPVYDHPQRLCISFSFLSLITLRCAFLQTQEIKKLNPEPRMSWLRDSHTANQAYCLPSQRHPGSTPNNGLQFCFKGKQNLRCKIWSPKHHVSESQNSTLDCDQLTHTEDICNNGPPTVEPDQVLVEWINE